MGQEALSIQLNSANYQAVIIICSEMLALHNTALIT